MYRSSFGVFLLAVEAKADSFVRIAGVQGFCLCHPQSLTAKSSILPPRCPLPLNLLQKQSPAQNPSPLISLPKSPTTPNASVDRTVQQVFNNTTERVDIKADRSA